MHLLVGQHPNKRSSKSRCGRASGQRANVTGHPALPGGLFCAFGNPLNDGTWQYEWVNGRQLARIYSVDTDASFVYNENGLRVQKTVNGVVTKYTLYGKNIVHMTQGSNELHFFYDAQNKPAVVVFNGTPYSYVKNLQGDIIAILDSNKNVVVSYVYDAWGRPISCSGTMANTLGKINPFRYRGYVYDEETGLYYLRSRYYSSVGCRFINADCCIVTRPNSIAGNLYTYCGNNAINRLDSTGKAWRLAILLLSTLLLTGCSLQTLASANDLDIATADPSTYNCYGNALGKQIVANPTGYVRGEPTRTTFERVKDDVGEDFVRELEAIDSPIADDETLVALRCGPMDYHFIRFDGNGWFNKSGTTKGVYISQEAVTSSIWYATYEYNGKTIVAKEYYYDDPEIIYFAVKEGWDEQ